MNACYIFKNRKSFCKEIGLYLLKIEGGSRRGWKSTVSEAGGGGASMAWYWGMKTPPLSGLLQYLLEWVYIISPNTRNCVAMRNDSISYELRVGGGVGKALILRRGGLIKGLVVGDEETLLPPSVILHPPLGWMYIISPNTRNCVTMRNGSVCYKLREWGGVGK